MTVFNTILAKGVTDQVWKSLLAWNKEHMQKMSGQQLWKDRLDITQKLEAAIAAPAAA